MKRRRNILSWAGFAVVVVALVSYIPFFVLFPADASLFRAPLNQKGFLASYFVNTCRPESRMAS